VGLIDSSARVADGARIGADVEIGPYCIVGPDVELGDGVRLHPNVHITGYTRIGPRTIVYPFASLGGAPQSVHYKGEPSRLLIGADCVLRENVTMNPGTAGGRMETRVGDRGMFMVGAHVGHDCIVGDDVVFANMASLGGHAEVGSWVFMGALSAVHQFTRVGEHALIAGVCGVATDIIPFAAAIGVRAWLGGLNVVGLKRRGFSREAIHALRKAYQMLFFGPGSLRDRADQVAANFAGDPNVERIVEFVRAGKKRSLATPRVALKRDEDSEE
jgi:UDP-N-acetylglucosamine acyltransferase